MSPTVILLLQSLLIFAQMANAGAAQAIHNPTVSVMLGAFVGAFQYFVQHVGNATPPPDPPATKSANA